MYIIFDTETTGLPKNYNAPITDTDNWPRAIQIAWQLHDDMGQLIEHQDYLIKPNGFNIPFDAERIHGISTELAMQDGVEMSEVLEKFSVALQKAKFVVGQNVGFDVNIMGAEYVRAGLDSPLVNFSILDTCTEVTANLLQLPGGRGGRFKLPTLTELHEYLFGEAFAEAHNATADVEATTRCFLELVRKGVFTKDELQAESNYLQEFVVKNPAPFQLIGLKHINLKEASEKIRKQIEKLQAKETAHQEVVDLTDVSFAHLHNHTQFSVLQSTIDIKALVKKTAKDKMPAVAMTDHGNLMGAFKFVSAVLDHNKAAKATNQKLIDNGESPTETVIKPIVGCEFHVCDNHTDKSKKDNGYQIVLLAKNKKGYHNLAKLSSIAFIDGFYYVPRIDREVLLQYKEDIIVLSGNMMGEIPNKLLNMGEKQAEEALLWWKEHFGEDFYIEVMRHGQEDENRVNQEMVKLARKHNVKLIATNNSYYLEKNEANAHDILLCVRDGEKQTTPIGRGRGYRYGLPNQEYYYKSQEEMKALFADLPDAIINIQEVIDKVEEYSLYRDILLPKFDIPEEFQDPRDLEEVPVGEKHPKHGENAYLRYLTYEGAKRRYGEITPEITERLDFELKTVQNSGYPGYFLIVQDFIAAARQMGVSVGPGRGSAAGSAVAYCLGITNLDPIKYDLLFERFLNPDRVSMPDIDIDFDDEGRGRVMEYVINKYGANQVAQIITYGKMATKSSIKDAARVLDLPLQESDRLTKLVPAMMPGKWNLSRFFSEKEEEVKKAVKSDEFELVKQLIEVANGNDLAAETLQQAKIIEGSMRNTGIHACGVIITPDDITNFVPVQTAKDSDLYVTQFDNSVAESAGLLKMDFLGLKTLTLIKDTIAIIKQRTGIEIDPEEIPINDEKTYQLFQRGETVGVFQYESPGMQKYMRELKPTVFADLIAMNALYRPGPLEYIPSFIRRKNGEEPITYDLDACEEYLKETYGITVYQEQVMLLSQKLADFTKGEADVLRKAMGKKQKDVLDKMKPKFVEQASKKGHDATILEKIWKDWEAFASYAFNKSHSTCYAWVAYQTAFLKAHYPAEFMAAVLSNNMNDIKQVTFFMEECKRMGLKVLGPDVNESLYKFTVNDNYEIRFGMGAIKGVGEGAVNTIIENRKEGKYSSIFDMAKRIDLRAANKKAFENLALAGGFDCFANTHRAQYFHTEADGLMFFEKAMKYGAKSQESANSAQVSLFGDSEEVQFPEPVIPQCEEWNTMERLQKEREVVGIYISGHPLDDFKHELKAFCNAKPTILNDLAPLVGKTLTMGGIVSNVQHRTSARGKDWAKFNLEGYEDAQKMSIFGEEYLKVRMYLVDNQFLFFRVKILDGFIIKNTGQKSDPKIQFLEIKLLNEILEKNTKKLLISMDLRTISAIQIHELSTVFAKYPGDIPIEFEVFESEEIRLESYKPMVENVESEEGDFEEKLDQEMDIKLEEMVRKIKKNMVELHSRNTKVKICNELLDDLERLYVDFSIKS